MRSRHLSLLLLLAAGVPASAADHSYQVANESDLTIMEIYASPAGEGRWGEDLLHVRVLPPGKVSRFPLSDELSRCDWDLRVIFENGRELVEGANLCAAEGYSVRRAP